MAKCNMRRKKSGQKMTGTLIFDMTLRLERY